MNLFKNRFFKGIAGGLAGILIGFNPGCERGGTMIVHQKFFAPEIAEERGVMEFYEIVTYDAST